MSNIDIIPSKCIVCKFYDRYADSRKFVEFCQLMLKELDCAADLEKDSRCPIIITRGGFNCENCEHELKDADKEPCCNCITIKPTEWEPEIKD